MGFSGRLYEGELVFTKDEVAKFLEVQPRTIENYLNKYREELTHNGYKVVTPKARKSRENEHDTEINFGVKTQRIGLFNFRSFLNLVMLMVESETARELLQLIVTDLLFDGELWESVKIELIIAIKPRIEKILIPIS